MVSQETTVNKELFEENANPYFMEEIEHTIPGTSQTWTEKLYYPFDKGPKSMMFSALNQFEPGIVPIKEIMLGIDSFSFDDAMVTIGFSTREKKFVNFKSTRVISDK